MSAENKGSNQDIGPTPKHFARQVHIRPSTEKDSNTGELKHCLNGHFGETYRRNQESLLSFTPGSPDEEVVHKVVVRNDQETNSED